MILSVRFYLLLLPLCLVLLGAEMPRTGPYAAGTAPDAAEQAEFKARIDAIFNDINISRTIAVYERWTELESERGWVDSTLRYLDTFHAYTTQKVHVVSANIDRELSSYVDDENGTESNVRGTPREGNISESMSDYFNRLFRDETYLYSSEASFMIVRIGTERNQREGSTFLNEIKFAISLPFTENKFQIFVGDPLRDENQEVVDDEGRIDSTTAVGARYFLPEFADNLKTDLSAGFRGLSNPFTRLRIEYPYNYYDWLFRPVQYVEYSVKREFYEETDLYIDRRISSQEMVRLQLQRSTETQTVGMQYATVLSYFDTLKYNTGFRTYFGLYGETILNGERYLGSPYDIDPHSGVYRYSLGGSWKTAFLRKWLFFEIEPRIDWDMVYAWKSNIVTRYWFEIYFGDM